MCQATAGQDTFWLCRLGKPLPESPHVLRPEVTDPVKGTVFGDLVAVMVDPSLPLPPPVIKPVALTNDPTPAITGTNLAGAEVRLKNQTTGEVLCTSAIDGNGVWTCTPSTPLPEGTAVLVAEITDPAIGAVAGEPIEVSVDTSPPRRR